MTVHIIGAGGRSGAALCRALQGRGDNFVPVVRSAERWAATRIAAAPHIADVTDAAALCAALRGAENIVSCVHARHAGAILAAAPPDARFVFLGSTRKFTRWPDAHGNGVLAGEAAFLASGRSGFMLHPTMIYGAEGENNVQRLAALLRTLPLLPLPAGGRALVQPIHQDDVTASILAALRIGCAGAETIIIAGPAPVTYADFVRAVAAASGSRPPRIMPVPALPLRLVARLTASIPAVPTIAADEIRRLTEDKAFPIDMMVTRLSVLPRPLEAGLATIRW